MVLVPVTVGVLTIFHAKDWLFRGGIIYAEIPLVYVFFLFVPKKNANSFTVFAILCEHFCTFCSLEFLSAALLIVLVAL